MGEFFATLTIFAALTKVVGNKTLPLSFYYKDFAALTLGLSKKVIIIMIIFCPSYS